MKNFIAERRLLYSLKGSDDNRKELVIRIGAPYLLEEGMVDFPILKGFAGCSVELDGPSKERYDEYGADLLQALSLAVNVGSYLKRLGKNMTFIFSMVIRISMRMNNIS